MTAATDLDKVVADLIIWQAHDQAVKADLFSTAIVTANGIFVVDPIPLRKAPWLSSTSKERLPASSLPMPTICGRPGQFAERFSVPIFAHRAVFPDRTPPQFSELTDGDKICDELKCDWR
mgnify:CR=1 FL=1